MKSGDLSMAPTVSKRRRLRSEVAEEQESPNSGSGPSGPPPPLENGQAQKKVNRE